MNTVVPVDMFGFWAVFLYVSSLFFYYIVWMSMLLSYFVILIARVAKKTIIKTLLAIIHFCISTVQIGVAFAGERSAFIYWIWLYISFSWSLKSSNFSVSLTDNPLEEIPVSQQSLGEVTEASRFSSQGFWPRAVPGASLSNRGVQKRDEL